MKKIILSIIILLLSASFGIAQNLIKGYVSDTDNEPLAGVMVMVKGTSIGTTTDEKGKYSIRAKNGDVLVFSLLGMVDKEITVKENTINAKMLTDNYALSDAVVIGYGTVKKSDLTGSVATVKPDELKNSKVGMLSNALQGTAAGVQVTSGNLKPGADASIIIRGVGSVNASSAPLYIVDGVPVSGLQDVSSSDIQSIEILKDASSASIYGSRGANGVVLITTKRGEGGTPKVSFNAMAGIQKMLNKQDLMNAQEYYDLVNTSGQSYTWTSEELRLLSRGESTDWQDAVTQKGSFQNYSISFTGGSEKIKNYLGVDYYDQEGIIKNSSFNKLTLRYNMDMVINDWVRVGSRFNLVYSKLKNINEEADSGYGTMFSAVSSQPTAPIYASDGSYFDGFLNTKANPVAIVELLDKSIKKTMAIGSVYLELEPIKNVIFRTDNTINLTSYRQNEYEDGRMGQHYAADGHASIMSNLTKFVQTENTITYNLNLNRNKVTFMAGFSASKTNYEDDTADSKGLNAITKYNNLGGAKSHGPNSSYAVASTLASFYGRVIYGFDDRYLLTLTMRSDGSSRFAEGHRWGYFPSAAFAWRISEEQFLKNSPVINNLKLRVSLGRLGNQNIGDYQYAALVSEGGYFVDYVLGGNKVVGAIYSSIANPNLTWEKANQFDVGLDLGFFKNRIVSTIDGYYKKTTDMLWTVPLPKESGYLSSLTNIGQLDNKGLEFSINTVNVNGRLFQWTTSFNLSYNKNTVKKLYEGKKDVNKTIFVGHSLNEFYLLKSDGIWQLDEADKAAIYGCVPGDRKIKDLNDDGVINGEDRDFCGQSVPRVYGGMTNTFNIGNSRIGNFDLTVFINYSAGYKVWNGLLRYEDSYNTWGNMSKDYYNHYWTVERPNNKYPAPRIGSPYLNGDGTDALLQNGNYLRIKNIELGYTLPFDLTEKIRLTNVRMYFSVQNLATFTNFTGYDVEAWDKTNTYPGARTFIGGISINF